MAVSTVSGSTTTSSALAGSRQTIAQNFDTFLSILTTQLKNQNPLDPLDTNQFTQQLVQFTGVEQQLKTNEFLEALVYLNSSSVSTSSQAMSLIGKDVTVNSAGGELRSGQAKWTFNALDRSDAATISVYDPSGNEVYSTTKAISAGDNIFTWDGVGKDGVAMPEGAYSIRVSAANASGTPITVKTQMVGRVQGVDLTGAEPYLMVGSARISVASVLSVRDPD